MKRRTLLCESMFIPYWKMNFNSKKGNKRSFSYETKASISFIRSRRMCLWCPIMKRKEIVLWIHVHLNWKMNFNSRNGNKRSFSFETKASISLTKRGECVYDAQSWKERRLFCESMFIAIERQTSILKLVIREAFLIANFRTEIRL